MTDPIIQIQRFNTTAEGELDYVLLGLNIFPEERYFKLFMIELGKRACGYNYNNIQLQFIGKR